MMKLKSSSFSGYCVGFLLLQVMTSTSEKWTVTIPTGHLVAIVGGQTELSCQLSPSQSAKHMEVSWFKVDHSTSKLVHLYRDDHEVKGKAASEYVDRTEFVKEAIGEGKVTLRLRNIRVSDNGTYQCSFKDSNFSNVASMDLNVAALGLETQIHIQAPGIHGLMVECNSGGWFPQPQMVCRDSKGEVIPHSSQSYSQDGAGLFHIKMTLLRYKSQGDMICYIRNPLSDEEKQIKIILAGDLFIPVHILLMTLFPLFCVMVCFFVFLLCQTIFKRVGNCYNKELSFDLIHKMNSICAQAVGFLCFGAMLSIYVVFRIQVSISDPFFPLYNDWIWYMASLVMILMAFYPVLICILYFTVRGVMETTEPSLTRYFVPMLLLQMITPSSEHFTVTGLQGPILAPFGGIVELSCQLSPPQNAEHMEIRWFRDRYTQPVYLYNNGKDLHVETISRYVERTELRKEAIREGKVTLRILNVSVDDHGEYHCFFKDGDFDEEAITDVKVTATSLEIQILVHPPNTKGLLVECSTGGWFPQPQMEWRDSRGEIILPTSISHSQDTHKLFNMKMTLLLKQSSHKNVTCCLRNPVTGQEERTSIVLSDQLFPWNFVWILILGIILVLLVIFIMVPSIVLQMRLQKPQEKGSKARPSVCPKVCTKDCLPNTGCTDCSYKMRNPTVVGLIIIVLTVSVIASLIVYLHHKSRVPASDPHFQLDTIWLEDITVILCVLTVFITMIISFIYFKFRGILEYRIQASNISSGTLDKSTVEEEACMATLQNLET